MINSKKLQKNKKKNFIELNSSFFEFNQEFKNVVVKANFLCYNEDIVGHY